MNTCLYSGFGRGVCQCVSSAVSRNEIIALIITAVWLSGNTLASINVVALHQTRLVLGWVTVCGRINHLGM